MKQHFPFKIHNQNGGMGHTCPSVLLIPVFHIKLRWLTLLEGLGILHGLLTPKNGSSIQTFQDGPPDRNWASIFRGQVNGKTTTRCEFLTHRLNRVAIS